MSITKPHIPSLSIFIALFMISVARTSSIKTIEFVENFLGAKKGDTIEGLDHVRQYLIKYGYMNSISDTSKIQHDVFDDNLSEGVRKYQLFSHLNSSGVLDAKTLAQMAMPRCGRPDFINGTMVRPHGMKVALNMSNGSYYNLGSSKWPRLKLTWALRYGTRAYAHKPVAASFTKWASVSKFLFIQSKNFDACDLQISFESGHHGDNLPFDGPGKGHLAHATMPTSGRLHFNADEPWVDGAYPGHFDIGTSALHEIGHMLGLEHSDVTAAIMWPYSPIGEIKGLHRDDIAGINAMYP